MARTIEPLDRRLQRLSIPEPNTGCWLWLGRITNAGYGALTLTVNGQRKTGSAHRAAYETFVGSIPAGMVIDHLCRVRACVNPEHLDVVTPRENVMRSPIAAGALNAAKTHCPQGHPYDEANTYRSPRTGRLCRACMRDRHETRKAVA